MQKDWRIINQEDYLFKAKLIKVQFPEFWEKALVTKNNFYELVVNDAKQFVEKYKKGGEFFKEYTVNKFWHTHCDFCTDTINTNDKRLCFCTEDFNYWICDKCYEDFKNQFEWSILNKD